MSRCLLLIFALFSSVFVHAQDCCDYEESQDIFQKAFSGAIEKDAAGRFRDFMWVTPTYPRAGMFAICNLVLGHLYLLDKGYYGGVAVDFADRGVYYDPNKGSNWWEYYFEPLAVGLKSDGIVEKTIPFELNQLAAAIRMQIPRGEAAALIRKHIKVQDYILEQVDDFASENFQDYFIIGLHYRGTDKSSEAPRVTYAQAELAVQEQISSLPHNRYKIFVATDERPFLMYIQKKFPGKVIYTEAIRSTDFSSVHHSAPNHYEVGRQAIVDALLLSRCDQLIRTSSNLSLWATYFNPDLPVTLLNCRFGSTRE